MKFKFKRWDYESIQEPCEHLIEIARLAIKHGVGISDDYGVGDSWDCGCGKSVEMEKLVDLLSGQNSNLEVVNSEGTSSQ